MFRYQHQFFGTVKPKLNFDATKEAESLHTAMKGFGCNKHSILREITAMNNDDRQATALQYKSMFGEDLIDRLKSELHGDFEEVIVALMTPEVEYDVRQLHHAISGIGTKEKILIEILCSRTNEQIHMINNTYQEFYGESLEDAIKSDTSGDFENLLVALVQGNRDESMAVDNLKANQDAHELEEAGEKQWGTDESVFIKILVSQNFSQLQRVLHDYEQITGHSIQEAIMNEFSGDMKDGLLTLVKNIRNQPAYFAYELHEAMKGFGTRDSDLIRIVVSRSEIDLALIRQEYEESYGKSLEDSIKSDCSGAYCDTLVAIVQGN
ncbi:unnamed protein product [Thelazia callipaeda]|uniref:Annexin n=1 Tax=Thelazia callipaeda TaxID=103827 RepID=A0A0N5D0W8_THECL|nr:unnamed protein product [Thelazia callipaeda]